MSYQYELLNYDEKRRGRDRRRFGMSMIYNYAEYCGPERRSGDDRRLMMKQGARSKSALYAV